MRTDTSVDSGAQPHCPDVSASLGPAQSEGDGEGSGTDSIAMVVSAAAAVSVSPFPGRSGRRLWQGLVSPVVCTWGGYPVFSHLTGNWNAGRGSQSLG